MKQFVFASRNAHKAKEVEAILKEKLDFDFEILTLDDIGFKGEIEENGKTFEENAMIKASAAYNFSSIPSFADDSGLVVDALDGAPGIFSARFASTNGQDANDEDNNNLLLEKLEGKSDRSARFVAAVAYIDGTTSFTKRGEVEGEILHERAGEGGFGYDPLFFCREIGKCFGTVPPSEKNRVSHRARAFSALADELNKK